MGRLKRKVRDLLRDKVGSPKNWGEERDPSLMLLELPTSQEGLPRRRMIDSYREASIPLGSKPAYKAQFVNQQQTVRIGKILESLDTMAVWIGYTHNDDPNKPGQKSPLSVVTAFVDSISLPAGRIVHDADIMVRGHVTWAGQTSMEITMHVDQLQRELDKYQTVLEATFLMVARDPRNKRKAFCNPLVVETEEEKAYFEKGEAHKVERTKQARQSLLKTPPSEEERLVVHDLFMQTLDNRAATFKRPVKPEGAVWMEDTKLKNIFLCFPETTDIERLLISCSPQRNLYNKIFGGFLMRVAFELGWINAFSYCKSRRVYVTAMDDIMFRRPVEIGALLYLSSQVVYTRGNKVQVKVHAETVDPHTSQHETTNEFHFTFVVSEGEVPPVLPRSYAEYMMYLDGRRHFEQQ